MRRFGLTNPQLLDLWRAMREAHITDADTARVFGCTRQYIHNRLGAQPDGWSEREWEKAREFCRHGRPIRELAAALGLTYRSALSLANSLEYTPERLAAIRHDFQRQQVKKQLLEFLEQGMPLTSICLHRWDRQKPYTTLHSRATRIQSLADWRRELGVEETTALHVARTIRR